MKKKKKLNWRQQLLKEIEAYHNQGGSRSPFIRKNPYFVKRRICAMCKVWPVSQSYLCYGCKDILLLMVASAVGIKVEEKKK